MEVLSATRDDEEHFKYEYMAVAETIFGVHFNFWLTTKIATPAGEYPLTHIIGLKKAIDYVTLPAIAMGGQLCLVFPSYVAGAYTMRIHQDLAAGIPIYMGAFLPVAFG